MATETETVLLSLCRRRPQTSEASAYHPRKVLLIVVVRPLLRRLYLLHRYYFSPDSEFEGPVHQVEVAAHFVLQKVVWPCLESGARP